MNKHFFSKTSLVLALTLGGSVSAALAAPAGGVVMATVNGEPITQEALVQRLLSYHGKATLEAMINRTLVNQEAKQLGLSVTDAEVDTRLGLVKNQFGGAEGYSRWLNQNEITEAQHRENVRSTLLTAKIINKTNPIKDADLELARVRIILLANEADARAAQGVLKNGGDFIQLARERSVDRQTGEQGGLLPPLSRVEFPDMWRAIADLKPGGTTEPVKLADGYAILKLEQRLPASQQDEKEKERNRARMLSVRIDQWLDGARKKAKITYGAPLPG
jgi:parvulin-like peptidyl-prolyl isomerase